VANVHEPDGNVAQAALLDPIPTDGTKIHGYLYQSYSDTAVTNVNWNDLDLYKIWGEAGETIIAETFTAGPDSAVRDTDTEISLLDSTGAETGLGNDDKEATDDDPWEDILGFNNTFSRMQGGPMPYTGWYYIQVNSYYNSITRTKDPATSDRNPGGGEYLLQVRMLPTGVDEPNIAGLPTRFDLSQNYPNPFNPETAIRYQLAREGEVTLTIHNILGQKVATLVDKKQPAGFFTVIWDGKDVRGMPVSSGVYFYRLKAGEFEKSLKMLLMK
jgi:hypothetical protein